VVAEVQTLVTVSEPGVAGFPRDEHTLTGTGIRQDRRVVKAGKIVGLMEVQGPHGLMVRGWMMFGKVVSTVGSAGAPKDVKLTLFHSVAKPNRSAYQWLWSASV